MRPGSVSGRTKVLGAALALCAVLALALAVSGPGAGGAESLTPPDDATPGEDPGTGDRGQLPGADPSATLADALASRTPAYVLIHSLT